jgi:hypothetical protein
MTNLDKSEIYNKVRKNLFHNKWSIFPQESNTEMHLR